MKGENSRPINIKRGVRQGCPLSPLLFNICLDPLLRTIEENHKNDGYSIEENSFCIQAFADDVILISDSVENMKKIINTCNKFCEKSGMTISSKKCHWLSYSIDRSTKRRVHSSERLNIGNENIEAEPFTSALTYLGAPIAVNKHTKMESTYKLIGELEIEVQKILNSPLSFGQIVDALKRMICPKLDYILLNGTCPLKRIQEFDKFLRSSLRKKLGCKGIPKNFFYTHWKDGGLSLPEFRESSQLLQIKIFLNMSKK